MKKLEDLIPKYPHVFSRTPNYGFDWFGFECHDGWHDLLEEAAIKLEPMITSHLETVDSEDFYRPTTSQIKEKYGTLRWYVTGYTDDMMNIINDTEDKSHHICEVCGKLGKLRHIRGWYSTLCEECTTRRGGSSNEEV